MKIVKVNITDKVKSAEVKDLFMFRSDPTLNRSW